MSSNLDAPGEPTGPASGQVVGSGHDTIEQRAINVVRALSMDAPLAANSGHQGTAMALAPLAHVLWTRVMNYDPDDPDWPDRDRFVLSAGHASILLYSMLHLTGYAVTLDDLRAFRQWGSRTPGHPEAGHTPGVEVTTGPLGQGIGNAVGLALAEERLARQFGAELFDHRTYAICSDGDLMEGVSHEAASLAGHLGLGKLTCVYDDNHITIDGPTELAYSDDAAARFASYGWHVLDLGEAANDLDALEEGFQRAAEVTDRPTLIVLRSHIGFPSPNMVDTPGAHGNALHADEVALTKEVMGQPRDEMFLVPDEVRDHYRNAGRARRAAREAWDKRLADWTGDRATLDAALNGTGLPGWQDALPTWEAGEKVATRKASNACLKALTAVVPGLVAGGADLTGNTGTDAGADIVTAQNRGGGQVYYGIREHGMAAAMTGMARHGGVIPVGGTFFVFSDYMRPSVRLAALSDAKAVFVWSHDSVGVGEDGPTHQPVEHLASLRAMPGLRTLRPADANETAAAWQVAVDVPAGPTALILSRQDLPVLDGTAGAPVHRGAYVLRASHGEPDLVLVGTGSEVAVCLEAAALLEDEQVATQVVSMPSWELFAVQDDDYQDGVLPPAAPTLAVEAASSFGWDRWVDDCVSIDSFGASAPGDEALAKFGFTAENVADRARQLLADVSA